VVIDVKKLREDFKEPFDFGITLFLRKWEPSNASDKAILILHGITAYSAPYEMFGNAFSKLGYNTFGLDLRGHGLSDGIRGDYPSKERLINDLVETVSFLKTRVSQLVIFGHSLGVAGISIRPGVYKSPSVLQKLKILISSIFSPSKPVINYNREGILGLDDPLFNFKYTLRFMRLFDVKKFDMSEELDLPIILGVGEMDELFSVESAKSLLEEINSNDKEFFTMPGAKHAEGFDEESFKKIQSWLVSKFS